MLLELIINVIHPFPYFEFNFTGTLLGQTIHYHIQTFFYALMFFKFYSVIRILAAYTSYSNNMSERYCEMFGSEADTAFALKAVQKDAPFLILTFTFCVSSVILGILLRMFEMLTPGGYDKYKFYTNGIWNIIVAMTTVGYGDYYPITSIGRFVVVLSIILGTLITSLTIVALNGITEFRHNEKRAFTILQRIEMRKSLHDACQKIIKYNFDLFKLRKLHNYHNKTLLDMVVYNAIIRKLKKLGNTKLVLRRELSRESFARDEDKFFSLNNDVDDEIYIINLNLKLVEEYITKFKAQLKQQETLIRNIENTLLIFRNCIKPAYYKLFAQNPNFIIGENKLIAHIDNSFVTTLNNSANKANLKEVAMRQIEYLLFYGPPKIISGSALKDPVIAQKQRKSLDKLKTEYDDFISPTNTPNIVIKNLLTKKVVETFQNYKDSYTNGKYLNDSIQSVQNEKDPVSVEYRKMQKLDHKTRQLYNATSKKTLDLLASLNNIKTKNNLIFGKGSSKDFELPAAPDIFGNLLEEDENVGKEKPLDKTISSDVGRPLLRKLKNKMQNNNNPLLNEEEDKGMPNLGLFNNIINNKNANLNVSNNQKDNSIRKANAQIDISSNDINDKSEINISINKANKNDRSKDHDTELFKSLNDVFAFMNQNPKLNQSTAKSANIKKTFMGRLKSSKDIKK